MPAGDQCHLAAKELYYSIMTKVARRSRFVRSIFATPDPICQDLFYTVHRAGHLQAGPEHHIRRPHFPGHELILCLAGQGSVRIDGHDHPVRRGDLVWVDCREPHQYGAVRTDPWEVYWIRVEGPRLTRLAEVLDVAARPVFQEAGSGVVRRSFVSIFDALEAQKHDMPARVHAEVAELLAVAFRIHREREQERRPDYPPELEPAVQHLRLFFFERCSVAELAELCGMSGSHFARRFRSAFGAGPIDWLRRYRIVQAKQRLVETDEPIKRIAEQVGYRDRFFFSKDFKKLAGVTPRVYRQKAVTQAEASDG